MCIRDSHYSNLSTQDLTDSVTWSSSSSSVATISNSTGSQGLATGVTSGDVVITATGHYSDGSTQDLTDSVTWASSSSATATVSNSSGSQGEVTAVAVGAATITATDSTTSIEGISAVTVLPAILLAITVSPTTCLLYTSRCV